MVIKEQSKVKPIVTEEQLRKMSEKELQTLYLHLRRVKDLEDMANPIYEPFRQFRGRYAVLIGGSGSGKSYACADKVVDRIVTEDNHRILCVRAMANQVSKSQFPLLVARLKKRYKEEDFIINRAVGQEKITCKLNSNEIIFAGLDDVDKLKSIFDITSVWVEEADQVLETDIRELNRRLRGYQGVNKNGTPKYMQISLSFNPVSVLSWIKKRFFDKKDKGQIMLHGEIPFMDCIPWKQHGELNNTSTLVLHTSYRDNRFIDDNYMKVMEELKLEDEGEYNIYGLGMWGVVGGTFFNKKSINERIQANIQPIKRGYFEFDYKNHAIVDDTIRWVDDVEGYIKIYESPKLGHPYCAGGDTAGDGSDFNTGCFTSNITGEDVAVLMINHDEDLYARQMYCLGQYYNNALLGIETNFSTHPLKELQRLGYSRLYYREEAPDSTSHKYQKKYGYLTTKLTRPQALGMLRQLVREEAYKIKDLDLLMEMTTFVKNDKGKPEASLNTHDDLVMARAINCYISHQQRNYMIYEPKKRKKLPFAFRSKDIETENFIDSGEITNSYMGGWQ